MVPEALAHPAVALALLIAGGASATGALMPLAAILTALSAMLLADALMYTLGRYTGWWLLGMLCPTSR